MNFIVRVADMADSHAICEIYNQGIEDRLATLETDLRTPEERGRWLNDRDPRHAVIVAQDAEGNVVGWGSLNKFNPRKVYDNVADFSVYIERSYRGMGIGSKLLSELINIATKNGFHKIVLAAFPYNEAGMVLYKNYGFREVGVYKEHGLVDGKWQDVIIMEKILQ